MVRRGPGSALVPYTTLFRSDLGCGEEFGRGLILWLVERLEVWFLRLEGEDEIVLGMTLELCYLSVVSSWCDRLDSQALIENRLIDPPIGSALLSGGRLLDHSLFRCDPLPNDPLWSLTPRPDRSDHFAVVLEEGPDRIPPDSGEWEC